ncbi:MAG: 2'-deoxycytidine 5'-triphosphate deaminase [Theionarchaea archaeon]|nr:2'-deoxycytidine 5'-triphosphate deaminase [Theionarchaea archaeon]
MSILTRSQLEKLIVEGWSCGDNKFAGLCDIEIHKGQKFFLLEDSGLSQEELAKKCLKESSIRMHAGEVKNAKRKKNEIVFQPGKFAFLTTRETVNMPLDVGGSMFMVPKVANTGLLFFTLGYVDPGFRGILTATILNCTNKKIPIGLDQSFFELVLEKLEQPVRPIKRYHEDPQDRLDVAANILYFNQNPGFALTSENFITRKQVFTAFTVIVTIIGTVYTILSLANIIP